MRRILAIVFVALAILPGASGAVPPSSTRPVKAGFRKAPKAALKVTCDREDALYRQGEKVVFRIVSPQGGEATYRLSEDGFKTIKQGKLTLEKGATAELNGRLDKPGFLQLSVRLGKQHAIAAAGVDPTRIKPTAKMPRDFDAFWDAGKKKLAGIPIDAKLKRSAKYSDARVDCYKNYRDIGMDDKNKSYYRAVILGCIRCNDYLTSRPDFNGKDLAVTGGSQGGALTLITSGVDPRVKLAAPNVAAMCDHSGVAHDRVSGWPHWLTRVKGEKAARVLETSAYYDAVNFARKFKGKSVHGVGFIDTVCAPTTVYSAFNVHPESKTMITSPLMGHGTDPRWVKARDDFWKKNLALKPPSRE